MRHHAFSHALVPPALADASAGHLRFSQPHLMTRVLTRAPIYRSSLTRLLVDLDVVEGMDAGAAFAEKLGDWLDFRNAIRLHGIHSAPATGKLAPKPNLLKDALSAELARRRSVLTASIQLPLPSLDLSLKPSTAYAPYRRHHLARQREMELQLRQLRSKLRGLLHGVSTGLQKLVDLDATFEQMLSERESKLFSSVPALLEKHFKHLLKEHAQDDPALWLPAFGKTLQAALLSELEVRLHPAMGLIDAYNEEMKNHHA
jgi:hypothetical protein